MALDVKWGLAIERGSEVEVDGKRHVITHVLDLDFVMAQDCATGKVERVAISQLRVPSAEMVAETLPDLSQLDGADWDEARRRMAAVKSLLAVPRRSRSLVQEHADGLGVNAATLYRWIQAYRETGKLSSLLPVKPNGGRGRGRIDPQLEKIIETAIEQFYLNRQQRSIRSTADEVARLCRNAGFEPPHKNTVRSRILAVTQRVRLRRRGHAKKVEDTLTPRPGHFDEAQRPLALIQIDHTKLDVMLVDAETRLPIGRPWITLAIDVFSRMVVGFYVSLDAPSANSTGLCLGNAILPKETWLAKRGVANPWPCWGFPAAIHLDNAKEFRGEMLRRACEEYDIEINFRPVATPHFGGHIERMLGTLATALHELPGTTFSNPKQRGDYDAEGAAALTLPELETYIAEYITGVYHRRVHSGIKVSPLKRWTDALIGTPDTPAMGIAARPSDEERIRLDFMPCIERTVQTYGVRIDEINYYSDVLRPYIEYAGRGRKQSYVFRRDPADISHVYFWDPEVKQYCSIPYRDVRHPAISVWELREVRRRLTDEGRAEVDEGAIFAAFERLRQHREVAVRETKRVRRERARKTHAKAFIKVDKHPSAPTALAPFKMTSPILPFDVEDV